MKRASPKRDIAEHFLRKHLAAGPQYQKSLEEKAARENINIHTLNSAAKTLKIEKAQASHGWQWRLAHNKNDSQGMNPSSYAPPPTHLSYKELRSWIEWSGAVQDPTIKALLSHIPEQEQPAPDTSSPWGEDDVKNAITDFFNTLLTESALEDEQSKLTTIEQKLMAHLTKVLT